MSYFAFLVIFIGLPTAVLVWLTWRDGQRGRYLPDRLAVYSPWIVLLAHILIALIYTTPWDNYLVATGVWWYDPALVTGITWGWVPIEEYTFFVVQPIFTGLWLLYWARHRMPRLLEPADSDPLRASMWVISLEVGFSLWVGALGVLYIGWSSGTYLALQLVWAIPPILLQLAFGADILWHYRRLILPVLIPTTLYLAAADAFAIQSGIWTIDPAQSLGWLLVEVLPFEEFLFFLLTNTLLIFGMTLVLAQESQQRLSQLKQMLRIKLNFS